MHPRHLGTFNVHQNLKTRGTLAFCACPTRATTVAEQQHSSLATGDAHCAPPESQPCMCPVERQVWAVISDHAQSCASYPCGRSSFLHRSTARLKSHDKDTPEEGASLHNRDRSADAPHDKSHSSLIWQWPLLSSSGQQCMPQKGTAAEPSRGNLTSHVQPCQQHASYARVMCKGNTEALAPNQASFYHEAQPGSCW